MTYYYTLRAKQLANIKNPEIEEKELSRFYFNLNDYTSICNLFIADYLIFIFFIQQYTQKLLHERFAFSIFAPAFDREFATDYPCYNDYPLID